MNSPIREKKIRKEQRKRAFLRKVAFSLAVYFLGITIMPTTSFALTGGPSQPEVQSFEPIGTSDMVDVFSGDFVYNIPLLDVEGYPINLSYHSGVTMDQEASWVGLGWNINPGVINRGMRGIPDDFNGDQIVHEQNMKPNRTYGMGANIDTEIFGVDALKLNASLGVTWNNYVGVGASIGLDFKASVSNSMTLGLGLNSSSSGGLDMQPSVSFEKKGKESNGKQTSLGSNISSSFSTRGGLQQLSISASVTREHTTRSTKKVGDMGTTSTASAGASFDFGQPTFTPQISQQINNFSLSARFKAGGEIIGVALGMGFNASYSSQWLKNKVQSNPAYGYMHLENGQGRLDALMDYNRENDGGFTPETPLLPMANLTYDMYSVSGQGVGGSYRPFRSEVGYVFDTKGKTSSTSGSIGLELGVGNLAHNGVDVAVNNTTGHSKKWTEDNHAAPYLKYKANKPYPDYENFYFKEANEKSVESDPAFYDKIGNNRAVRFGLDEYSKYNVHLSNRLEKNGGSQSFTHNFRDAREKKNQVLSYLTINDVRQGMGIEQYPTGSFAASGANGNHIGQIITLGSDGGRYVYGLPAFNRTQEEVTFAVGSNALTNNNYCLNGQITYNSGDNSSNNSRGDDNYFSKTTTPAYAHSYLLTSIVSPDYIDVDNNGPSTKDLGSYTKFGYELYQPGYNWRTPIGDHVANFSEGLKADPTDDKASYVYGTKELWYLNQIETKNFIAIFHTSTREDGVGVNGPDGDIPGFSSPASMQNASHTMKKLDKISLYAKPDYEQNGANATPIKEVHFEYNYELCPGIQNNAFNGGKLTLTKVYFTYRNSNKGNLSPYVFKYADIDHDGVQDVNYAYNIKGYDRWGNFKEETGGCGPLDAVNNTDYPYTTQDETLGNKYAAAWSLTEVDLPSGGSIKVDYEADDYAYVQDRKAMEMYKINGVSDNVTSNVEMRAVAYGNDGNRTINISVPAGTDLNKLFEGIDNLYFKCLVEYPSQNGGTKRYNYVPGYAQIESKQYIAGSTTDVSIKLKGVKLKDSGPADYNPIALAGIQFGRLYLNKYVGTPVEVDENAGFGLQLIQALGAASANFIAGFKNYNKLIYDYEQGTRIILNKSFIRLNNTDGHKLGGGARVKQLVISDNWEDMTTTTTSVNREYGQIYTYENEDGTSSGIAAYEPQIGGDENPFKQPIYYSQEKLLAPDDKFYKEEPVGESFFPSASVGYSRVTVQNKPYNNVKRHATGKVVHEFYTAKDFPTIVERTGIDNIRHKTDPWSLTSIFNISSKDYMTASQGFAIELNDMHGKPKSQKVYQEEKTDPITKVEYEYQSVVHTVSYQNPFTHQTLFTHTANSLDNTAKVIYPDGTVNNNARLGVFFDMVTDFRESKSNTISSTVGINLETFALGPIVLPVPTAIPTFKSDKVQFRSSATTKVIQKFGILKSTKAYDLGSMVETKNLAYDAMTGDVLLTETTTDFNDKIYTLNYPAYWYYDAMGMAYKNIGFQTNVSLDANGNSTSITHPGYFVDGDELLLTSTSTGGTLKGWVVDVNGSQIKVVNFAGNGIAGSYKAKVIRSGRRNMQAQSMASITSRKNPLDNFQNNIFENVIQASAIEFDGGWRTYCDCFDDGDGGMTSTNPYVIGTKGIFRPKASYLHLSGRTQENYNNNTDIRQDGMFTSYTPFYKLDVNNRWEIDRHDWTYTAEVTEFNPYGQELENKDALGRYSAATFGFNQTLATAVAANARYSQIGFDSFEDYGFSPCADNHFKFDPADITISETEAHTGFHSVRVVQNNNVHLEKQLDWCDPVGCSLSIAESSMVGTRGGVGTTNIYTPTAGAAPYVFNYNIISGNPDMNVDPATRALSIVITGGNYQIEFTYTDSEGCEKTKLLTVLNGQIQP